MSKIITLNGAARSTKRGSDFATLDEVGNAVMNTYGPVAQLCMELAERVQALEDHLGIVAPLPTAPPSGDIE